MKLYNERTNQTKIIKLEKPKKLSQILGEENISIESVILVKNNQICLENEIVEDNDEIKLLSVVSGG